MLACLVDLAIKRDLLELRFYIGGFRNAVSMQFRNNTFFIVRRNNFRITYTSRGFKRSYAFKFRRTFQWSSLLQRREHESSRDSLRHDEVTRVVLLFYTQSKIKPFKGKAV